MSSSPLTIRVRLTLIYTGLFLVCGAIVVAITYGLVASLPQVSDPSWIRVDHPEDFLTYCRQALDTADESLNGEISRL